MTAGPHAGAAQASAAEDRQLMQAHVAGDPEAFGKLFLKHRHRLWAVALRTLSDREEAADALQDGLIAAFRGAHTYRGDAAVTTWLHRIVVNACLDRVRRKAARPSQSLGDTDVPWGRDEHRSTEVRLDIESALNTLPAPQRAAIVLVDMHDVPVAEAAAILGVAQGTIKSRCSRARMALARALRADAESAGQAAPPVRQAPGSPPGNTAPRGPVRPGGPPAPPYARGPVPPAAPPAGGPGPTAVPYSQSLPPDRSGQPPGMQPGSTGGNRSGLPVVPPSSEPQTRRSRRAARESQQRDSTW